MCWAELSTGVRLPYISVGPGSATPVVLRHAWGESRRCFDRLLPKLADTVHVVAVDQRGHGEAARPPTGYSLAAFGEDIVEFLDAPGFSSAVLLGSSSGGYVAQHVAAGSPRHVAGLVLVGSPHSLRGCPAFADSVNQLRDPVSEAWVRASLTWFPRFEPVPQWYIDDRVRDGAAILPTYGARPSTGSATRRRPATVPTSRPPPSSCGATAIRCWAASSATTSLGPFPARDSSSQRRARTHRPSGSCAGAVRLGRPGHSARLAVVSSLEPRHVAGPALGR